ncbi:MAG: efflux RND transporter periplasmic adaptor subunit [Acidobacteriota bacterium]
MKTRTYQLALAAAVSACILLGGALVLVLRQHSVWPRFWTPSPTSVEDPVIARGPQPSAQTAPSRSAMTPSPLAPEPLASRFQISPQRLQEIGVTTAPVTFTDLKDELDVPGNVDVDEEKLAYVQTRFSGWIQDVYANATYQYVRKGQPLFTIYSPDLVSSEEEFLLARQNQKTFAPETHPAAGKPTGTDSMATAEGDWLLRAAAERLRQFGVPPQAITDLEQSGKVQRNMTINSPASGYITDREALPNAYAQPQTRLYTIANLSTVWVYANVSQDEVSRLRPGDPGQVTVDAYPGRTFRGHVDQILPQVDPATRTVRVRMIFSNPGVVLKPGMYVNVRIDVSLGWQLVVPASAILQTGERSIAFVSLGQGYLEPRVVQTGPQVNDSVVVLSGLKAGEQVVSSANFLVDSEAQLQTLAGFSPPPPSTAAGPAPTAQMQIQLTTQPSPLRTGTDALRVKLTAPNGEPLSGPEAEGLTVTAALFLPAMPEMGMAAQHLSVALHKGADGLYQGTVQLPSGGAWQTAVEVQRGGRTLATRQLHLDVTGGME